MLGESIKDDRKDLVPKEEQRKLLPSSKVFDRCSSLSLSDSLEGASTGELDYLATLIVEAFLDQKQDEWKYRTISK